MDKHTFGYESNGSYVEWDVKDIWEAAKKVTPIKKRLAPIFEKVREITEEYTEDDFRRAEEADLSYPPILSPNGTMVLDGVHRLYKLNQLGREWVIVKILKTMPLPRKIEGKPFKINGLDFEWRVK